jgi:hypothetical protein
MSHLGRSLSARHASATLLLTRPDAGARDTQQSRQRAAHPWTSRRHGRVPTQRLGRGVAVCRCSMGGMTMHTLVTGEVCQRCGRPHLQLWLIATVLVKPALFVPSSGIPERPGNPTGPTALLDVGLCIAVRPASTYLTIHPMPHSPHERLRARSLNRWSQTSRCMPGGASATMSYKHLQAMLATLRGVFVHGAKGV